MESIADRIARIQEQIAAAARQAGRAPEDITLIGISKLNPATAVAAAFQAGLRDFGESRVQEAEPKLATLAADRAQIRWHLIGHLQSNKAKKAAALFDMVHTVDSLRLAAALSRSQEPEARSQATLLPRQVLLQVNVSGEAAKAGFALAGWPQHAPIFEAFCGEVAQILALPGITVRGLMTIAPYSVDPLPTFRSVRVLRAALAQRFPAADWSQLSMGMSDDFAAAVAEGATLVRVGRAIFGERTTV